MANDKSGRSQFYHVCDGEFAPEVEKARIFLEFNGECKPEKTKDVS